MPALSTYTPEIPAVDVAVIGAGINGLAVAREAAARGLTVALFDQDDLAARTSAISTRLIHGGLKYLERFELHLVYESIRERNILLAKAPHLVHHYPMLIPFSKKQSRQGWLLACGLMLHDVLSLGKPLPLNRVVFRKRLQRDWPALAEAGLRWGGLFHDANVPVTERLAVELAKSLGVETPVGSAAFDVLKQASGNGLAGLDVSAVLRLREEQAGVKVRLAQ